MHKIRKNLLLLLLCFLWIFAIPAYAASVTKAPSTSVTDVRKAPIVTGSWEATSNGTKFLKDNGTYLKSCWMRYQNHIYYMNKKGYRTSGWILYRKAYYYMNKSGQMLTGWINNQKYYLLASGKRASGPVQINGEYYYFNSKTGKKETGWITFRKKNFYFSPQTGKKVCSSWVKTGSNWRYVNESGVMQKSCWLVLGKKKYYVDSSGNRVTGEQYINGKWYFFKSNGVYDPTHKITINVDPSKKMVALTFDDGPGPYTETLLRTLRSNNARATFFMVGNQVKSYSSTVKKMLAQHCELGNHSYTHANLANLSTSGITSEITRTNSAIRSVTGKNPTVARLPYGSGYNNSRVLGALNLPSIYWSIDTNDWQHTGNPSSTVSAVLNNVRNGDIVLMHDIHSATVTAAKTIIPALKNRGYQMVTVTELARYKGKKSLHSGTTYFHFR